MAERAHSRRRRATLRSRLALWIALSTAISLTVFAVVAYLVVLSEESGEVGPDGQPEDTSREVRDDVLVAMAFAAPVGLILAAIGASWLTRRALAPVDQVIRSASEISASDLDRRLAEPARDDELRDLTRALNGLLERLQGGFDALSLFAANASHELRTPLAAVCSELEIALRRPRSVEEWQQSAETSLGELRRLASLVDALLQLARTGSGRPLEEEDVDLVALIDDVVAGHASAAGAAGIDLVSTQGSSVIVQGNPDALASALSNLLANAIRFTPRGGTVRLQIDSSGGRASVLVDDTGPGVRPDTLEQLFEPFARGESLSADSAPSDQQGFGLGLAIARSIALAHGGQLLASNRPEGGARFRLELPLPAS